MPCQLIQLMTEYKTKRISEITLNGHKPHLIFFMCTNNNNNFLTSKCVCMNNWLMRNGPKKAKPKLPCKMGHSFIAIKFTSVYVVVLLILPFILTFSLRFFLPLSYVWCVVHAVYGSLLTLTLSGTYCTWERERSRTLLLLVCLFVCLFVNIIFAVRLALEFIFQCMCMDVLIFELTVYAICIYWAKQKNYSVSNMPNSMHRWMLE